jgi:predicted negative regulator of RcsB-dependent stress response
LARRGEILQQAGRPYEAREAFQQSIKSIETLPLRYRKTKAILDLEARVRKALNNTGEPKP